MATIKKVQQFIRSIIKDKSVSDKVVQRMARFYGMEVDQLYPELQMFNQFKLHIKMNLKSLFVSWFYLQKITCFYGDEK